MAKRYSVKYVVDEKGKKVGVLVEMNWYRDVLAHLEEVEAILAYDTVKASGEKPVEFGQREK